MKFFFSLSSSCFSDSWRVAGVLFAVVRGRRGHLVVFTRYREFDMEKTAAGETEEQ